MPLFPHVVFVCVFMWKMGEKEAERRDWKRENKEGKESRMRQINRKKRTKEGRNWDDTNKKIFKS